MYAPVVQSASPAKKYAIADCTAVFFDNIVPKGRIRYSYIVAVFAKDATQPFLFITAEKSETGIGPGSDFLCIFDEEGHHNFGASDDWGDAAKFEARALEILRERLDANPVEVPSRADKPN
jgi:hypothetical protein